MKSHWTVRASSAACFLLFFPCLVSGQQETQQPWQGGPPRASLLQPQARPFSSQKPAPSPTQPSALDPDLQPSVGAAQTSPQTEQLGGPPSVQDAEAPTAQREIPVTWPPAQSAVSVPGYLGANTRDFYRARLCMHAMTIQAVEVTAVAPGSPAERAGLRPARDLTRREVAAATVAGLFVLSPAAPLAAKVLRAAGGVDHGDLILAVSGKRVTTRAEFERALAGFAPQAVVYMTVRRGDAVMQLPVRLDN
jgi:hypothetical protein